MPSGTGRVFSNGLQIVANIATLVVACLLSIVLLRTYFLSGSGAAIECGSTGHRERLRGRSEISTERRGLEALRRPDSRIAVPPPPSHH